ncbi:PAS/PAC sensor hybrid histidine kinase [Caballeronia pedi]|uniref:histidine kinase n=1 Tax=Caballeronia pedi TaxID=1777141 RepID=A0A158DXL7_9BURK|nr:ATP-binding protein [Caballeronia pedi]SAK99318.1 PAS/PAC sensor hybrid histidine kinase [Caballeronia pedi]
MSLLLDPARLAALESIRILDTPADPHFDALTRLTAHALRVPQAFINFVDGARTWCKSAWGSMRKAVTHAESLCALALLKGDDLVMFDATRNDDLRTHPECAGNEGTLFYMAFVLRTPAGLPLGTLCIKDRVSREPVIHEMEMLRMLGEQVALLLQKMLQIELTIEEARRGRDQFLAMLAHELCAPMSPILTAVQVLGRSAISTQQRSWARKLIARHVRHLGQIVEHLLSASLVSLGAIDLRLEPIAVDELVDQALEMAEGLLAQRQHRVTRSSLDHPWVMADRVQCPLIIANLLTNAAKYTPERGLVDIDIQGNGQTVTICVTDTGIGIAAADMEEIFQIFGQSDRSLDRARGGMGLGLPLARRLAEWHGGSLRARSDPLGHGSEFTLTLKQATPTEETRKKKPKTRAACVLDIVVVDDSVDTADALAAYYQLSGHTVRTAYHAHGALRMMQERAPDILLSDIGLPEIDGYALVRKLRALPSGNVICAIAVTGYGSMKDRQAALTAGFDGHFSKPVDLAKLDTLIEDISRMRRS